MLGKHFFKMLCFVLRQKLQRPNILLSTLFQTQDLLNASKKYKFSIFELDAPFTVQIVFVGKTLFMNRNKKKNCFAAKY